MRHKHFNLLRSAFSNAMTHFIPYVENAIVDGSATLNKIGLPTEWVFPTLQNLMKDKMEYSKWGQGGYGTPTNNIPSSNVIVDLGPGDLNPTYQKEAIGHRNKMKLESFAKIKRTPEQKINNRFKSGDIKKYKISEPKKREPVKKVPKKKENTIKLPTLNPVNVRKRSGTHKIGEKVNSDDIIEV